MLRSTLEGSRNVVSITTRDGSDREGHSELFARIHAVLSEYGEFSVSTDTSAPSEVAEPAPVVVTVPVSAEEREVENFGDEHDPWDEDEEWEEDEWEEDEWGEDEQETPARGISLGSIGLAMGFGAASAAGSAAAPAEPVGEDDIVRVREGWLRDMRTEAQRQEDERNALVAPIGTGVPFPNKPGVYTMAREGDAILPSFAPPSAFGDSDPNRFLGVIVGREEDEEGEVEEESARVPNVIRTPDSSLSLAVGYNPDTGDLSVVYTSGERYDYHHCPEGLWEALEETFERGDSVGSFINLRVKVYPNGDARPFTHRGALSLR